MRRALLIALILFCFVTVNKAIAQSQTVTNGLSYLSATQNPDGSWSGPATSAVYNTFTSLEALLAFNKIDANYGVGLQWCQSYPAVNVDYLSNRIMLLSRSNLSYTDDLNTLLSLCNTDTGGWGLKSYSNDLLDTALALQALKAANYSDYSILAQAINFLTSTQNSDGGWGSTVGGESTNYVTALVLKALSEYSRVIIMQETISKASSYLLSKQNTDGGFGNSPSTVYDTALSVISLIDSGSNSTQSIVNGINYLASYQSPDGSWDQDPYYTALALQALAAARPNLTVSNISLSQPMPREGEETIITATIKNAGFEDTSNVVVRFYIGDPSAGGVQIGVDQIIPSLSVNSTAQVSVNSSFSGTGGKTIFVVVDPDNSISETSESDNKSSARIWVATGPDLAVYSEDLKPSTYVPVSGTPFTLGYKIRNLGESGTGAFSVALYDGAPDAGGTLLQTVNISGLAGTEVRSGSVGVTLTGNGSHTLYLVADKDNAVTEISKTNNTGSVTVQVGGTQKFADLMVGMIQITPARPTTGEMVQITAPIRNKGSEAASFFTVEIFDGLPDAGGTLINAQTISLASGAEQIITANWAIASGIHDLYLIVDRSNQINETNETNNQTTLRVMPDMVDLLISATDLTFTPEHPVNGDIVLLSAELHNTGIKDTGAFNFALYDGDPAAGGTLLKTFSIANIAGDASTTVTYNLTAVPWTYRFYAIADTENVVTELYEANNLAIRSLKIKAPGEILGPDLVPIDIDLTEATTNSQTLALSGKAKVTFQNKGNDKVIIFDDKDNDNRYTAETDTLLGTGAIAIKNLDDDQYSEIVLLITHVQSQPVYMEGSVYLLEHDGNVKWGPVYLNNLAPDALSASYNGAKVKTDLDEAGEPLIIININDKDVILDRDGYLWQRSEQRRSPLNQINKSNVTNNTSR